MAVRSLSLSAINTYEYKQNYDYKYYYFDFSGEEIASSSKPAQGYGRWLLFSVRDTTSDLGHHVLYSAKPTARIRIGVNGGRIYANALNEPLPVEPTGSNIVPAPTVFGTDYHIDINSYVGPPGQDFVIGNLYWTYTAADESELAFYFLKNKAFRIGCNAGDLATIYRTLLNGDLPTVEIQYDDRLVAREFAYIIGPTSGYINPRNAITFGWELGRAKSETYRCLNEVFLPVHETIYWRESGTSNWTSISVTDGAASYEMPANTWSPGTTIEWYLSVVDDDGITTTSEIFTVSTTDDDATAIPSAPINSVEVGTRTITFVWSVTNPTGEAPSRIKIEWATSADAVSWNELCDLSGAYYEYEAAAGVFPGGDIYWKVTAYNADGVAGPTSTVVVFSCVSAPNPPTNIISDGAPFATISWQALTQSAFEISIDGKVVVKKFGAGVYSYKLTEPLSDGEHTVSIKVQGAFGYWSDSASATIIAENNGSGSIEISAAFGIDANIDWDYSEDDNDTVYRIYRDGKLIARTKNSYFSDRVVLGFHNYYILAELSGGNYCRSSEIAGTLKSDSTMISSISDDTWMSLKLSEDSIRMQTFEWTRSVAFRHYAGSVYPVAEFSPFEDRLATYDCAFANTEDAQAFERLCGQVVILKSRGDEVVIGPLTTVSKTVGNFYISYRFNVSQIHWEDLIDDTNN